MKNRDALKTIGEVSKELGIQKHVIRFWESKFKNLVPIQKKNGRRYYTSKNILIIREIKNLLYDQKYSIKGATEKLNNQSKINKTFNKEELILDLEFIKKKINKILSNGV